MFSCYLMGYGDLQSFFYEVKSLPNQLNIFFSFGFGIIIYNCKMSRLYDRWLILHTWSSQSKKPLILKMFHTQKKNEGYIEHWNNGEIRSHDNFTYQNHYNDFFSLGRSDYYKLAKWNEFSVRAISNFKSAHTEL